MFDFSFSELLLCFVVALVVLGPERLPGVARGIGRWTGKARAYMRNLSAELDRESSVAELKAQLSDARRILNEESVSMKQSFHAASTEGRAIVEEVREAVTPPPPSGPDPDYHHDELPGPTPPSDKHV
jgi:sec-independent protein translocase protein TatB